MGLQLVVRHSGNVAILDLLGRATIGNSNDLLSTNIRKLIDGGESNVLLNLSGVTQLDSSSISTIVRGFVSLRNKGGALKLLNAHGTVKMVLETLHLLDAIPTFDDEATVLASFQTRKASSP